MRISDLIAKLVALKEKEGDLTIIRSTPQTDIIVDSILNYMKDEKFDQKVLVVGPTSAEEAK